MSNLKNWFSFGKNDHFLILNFPFSESDVVAVSVVRALPSTLLPTTINVLCTILKNSTTLVLTRCPWTWPTSFKAWKPSKDWSRFESPTYSVGSSTDPQICINRFTHIKKKVSQILTITLVRISKRLKKKTMKSRFLKTENWKNTKVSWSQNFDWLMKTLLQISEWKNFALSRWNFFVRSQNSLTLVIQSKFLAKRFCIDTSVRCISQPWQVAPPSGRGFNLFAFHAHFKSVQCLQYSATEKASLALIEFLIFVSSAENFLPKFHHPSHLIQLIMSLTDQHSTAEPCCLRQLFTLFPYYVKIKINERWKVRHRLNHVLVIYYFFFIGKHL